MNTAPITGHFNVCRTDGTPERFGRAFAPGCFEGLNGKSLL